MHSQHSLAVIVAGEKCSETVDVVKACRDETGIVDKKPLTVATSLSLPSLLFLVEGMWCTYPVSLKFNKGIYTAFSGGDVLHQMYNLTT